MNEEVHAKLSKLSDADIIRAYRVERKKKEDLTDQYNQMKAAIDVRLSTLEAHMLNRLSSNSQNSVSTAHGTAFKQKNTFAKAVDRRLIVDYVVREIASGHADPGVGTALDIFTNHVSKDYCVRYREEHKVAPPGVDMTDQWSVTFRKPSTKED